MEAMPTQRIVGVPLVGTQRRADSAPTVGWHKTCPYDAITRPRRCGELQQTAGFVVRVFSFSSWNGQICMRRLQRVLTRSKSEKARGDEEISIGMQRTAKFQVRSDNN